MSSLFNIAAGNPATASFYDYQIDNSLRFEDGSSAELTRTPSSTSNRQTWTFSAWLKRGNLNATQEIFISKLKPSGTGNNVTAISLRDDNTFEVMDFLLGNFNWGFRTLGKFRDVSSWYHLVVECDSTQATASDRVKLYINGVLQSVETYPGQPSSYPNQNENTNINFTYKHDIGIWDGYMADVNFIDGTALDPTSFGEPKSGVWIPKDTSGLTFGTNGFRLEFGDSSAIGDDTSGNGNDYTVSNLSAHDVVPDSPTLNYATANVLAKGGRLTLAEGNLRCEADSSTTTSAVPSTIGMTTGKWYAEYYAVNPNSSNSRTRVGISSKIYLPASTTENQDLVANGVTMIIDGTSTYRIYENGTLNENSGTVASGDIIGIAFDADAQTVEFYLNGVQLGTNNPYDVASVGDGIYYFMAGQRTSADGIFNFGQDSTFAGATTAGGNSDENGYGDFKNSVPSGYLALNSANLPEPAISPLDDEVPEDYFEANLWTGNGTSQSISSYQFSPDFVWIKERNSTSSHNLYNTIMGTDLFLRSDTTDSEISNTINLTSFDSNGFSLGSGGNTNENNNTYVGWCWKAGTSFSNSAGANGADIASSGSVSTKSGFSIVEYTGSNSANDVVYHGIGTAPSLIIIKNRDVGTSSGAWGIFTDRVEAERLQFDDNDDFNNYPIQSFDANTFQLPTLNNTAWSAANDYIAYCFASIEGYSKIGIYTGNGSADGTFVYTGFRPAWIMVKRSSATSSASGWFIADNARNISNVVDNKLTASSSQEENDAATIGASGSNDFDFLSNGFKPRATNSGTNNTDDTYLYMAFAEMPQKYANAR